ncbi:MAG: dihydroorotate dehydrogenase electron transfer subunit [Bacteroidales bacterium]|nr:dihydroorotate dehydrogenase electron transfer subunit [Bacteroidales bacterium]
MQKRIFRIASNEGVARDTFRLVLRTEGTVAVRSGQFVDIALPGFYLRRPISVSDCLPDGVVLYYKVVGEGTRAMSEMAPGTELELLLPLGSGFHPEKCREHALLIGGGLGAAPLYLLAKELLAAGKQVTAVLGFNRADEICLAEELRALGVPVHIATMDGSVGTKGFVTDAIAANLVIPGSAPESRSAFDRFYTCGPLPMMKAVCTALDVPGEVSLEERMGCGAGFCYGCSIQTARGPKRVCVDGPVFDKEDVLW